MYGSRGDDEMSWMRGPGEGIRRDGCGCIDAAVCSCLDGLWSMADGGTMRSRHQKCTSLNDWRSLDTVKLS